MFSWLFGKSRVHHRSEGLLVIRYKGMTGDFYIGAFDTDVNFVETKATLEALGRLIEAKPLYHNSFLTEFERLGHCLRELGYETVRTIGNARAWYIDRPPSTVFVTSIPPDCNVYQLRTRMALARGKKRMDKVILEAVLDTVDEFKKKSKDEEST